MNPVTVQVQASVYVYIVDGLINVSELSEVRRVCSVCEMKMSVLMRKSRNVCAYS